MFRWRKSYSVNILTCECWRRKNQTTVQLISKKFIARQKQEAYNENDVECGQRRRNISVKSKSIFCTLLFESFQIRIKIKDQFNESLKSLSLFIFGLHCYSYILESICIRWTRLIWWKYVDLDGHKFQTISFHTSDT